MGDGIERELRELNFGERALYHALRRRFGRRLGLPDAVHLHAVRRAVVPPVYEPGRSIIRESDRHDALMIIGAGTVKVTCVGANGKSVIVQMVNDGHGFGFPLFANGTGPRPFGAIAHTSALVGILAPDALRDILAKLDLEQRLRLLAYGWNAILASLQERRLLLSLSIADRIWFLLWRLSRRLQSEKDARVISVRLTHEELGQMVGAGRSTVCRTLSTLIADGRISLRQGRYVVLHVPPWGGRGQEHDSPLASSDSVVQDEGLRNALSTHLREYQRRHGLPARAVQAFQEHARFLVCPSGAPFGLPDGSDALTLLLSGAVCVETRGSQGEPLPLFFLRPGQMLTGKGALGTRSSGVRAVAHAESCGAILTREGLTRMLATLSAAELLRFLASGWRLLSRHQRRQSVFLTMTDKQRVLHQLEQLAADFPQPHDDGTVINLRVSHHDIGRLVAASDSSVSRCIRALEEEVRIAFVGGAARRILILGLLPQHRAA